MSVTKFDSTKITKLIEAIIPVWDRDNKTKETSQKLAAFICHSEQRKC